MAAALLGPLIGGLVPNLIGGLFGSNNSGGSLYSRKMARRRISTYKKRSTHRKRGGATFASGKKHYKKRATHRKRYGRKSRRGGGVMIG